MHAQCLTLVEDLMPQVHVAVYSYLRLHIQSSNEAMPSSSEAIQSSTEAIQSSNGAIQSSNKAIRSSNEAIPVEAEECSPDSTFASEQIAGALEVRPGQDLLHACSAQSAALPTQPPASHKVTPVDAHVP